MIPSEKAIAQQSCGGEKQHIKSNLATVTNALQALQNWVNFPINYQNILQKFQENFWIIK